MRLCYGIVLPRDGSTKYEHIHRCSISFLSFIMSGGQLCGLCPIPGALNVPEYLYPLPVVYRVRLWRPGVHFEVYPIDVNDAVFV